MILTKERIPFKRPPNFLKNAMITEDSLKEKANKNHLEINRLPLNKAQKKEKIQDLENKKACLLAFYNECKGLIGE